VSGGARTNGDNPFVKQVMEGLNSVLEGNPITYICHPYRG